MKTKQKKLSPYMFLEHRQLHRERGPMSVTHRGSTVLQGKELSSALFHREDAHHQTPQSDHTINRDKTLQRVKGKRKGEGG